MIGRWLLRLARSSAASLIIGWVFTHCSFVLPVDRLRETKWVLAFHHPSPQHALHILLVPKRSLTDLAALTEADRGITIELLQVAASLVAEYQLEQTGYRLITNGGVYQDVGQLHFHLISDHWAGNEKA